MFQIVLLKPASHCLIITESEGTQSVVQSDEICFDCFGLIVSIPLPDCWAKFLSDSEKLPFIVQPSLRAATNESQKTRNKKQNGLAHLQFLVCVTPKQKKTLLDSRIKFLAKHV